jgi:SAM-dependent methyltransferase
VSWEPFDRAAARYDAWYDTPRGQRVERAERALLDELLTAFPGAESLLDVGCGTGRCLAWLAPALRVVGVDRSPAMLAEMGARHPEIPAVLGDAHRLPLPDRAIDVVLFVTTLEFLDDPLAALREAVRVARRGVILLALNCWSVGGLSRRAGAQARSALRAQARDFSLLSLRALALEAAGARLVALPWASTLFPDGLWSARGRLPLGDVLGMAVVMAEPNCDPARRLSRGSARGASGRIVRSRPRPAFLMRGGQTTPAHLQALEPPLVPFTRGRAVTERIQVSAG